MAPNIDRLIRMYLNGRLGKGLSGIMQGWLLTRNSPEQDASLRRSFDRMVRPRHYADRYTRRSLSVLHDELGFARGRSRMSWQVRYAAVAILVCAVVLGGVASYSLLRPESKATFVAEHVVSGEAGSSRTLAFPDGTLVTLKDASTITYMDDYSEHRRLWLNGEAYFVVAHDAERPFVVTGGEMRVEVLGTEFNLRSSHAVDVAEVVLIDGSVDVSNREDQVRLLPGQKATAYVAAGTMDISEAVVGELARYQGAPLSLYDVTLHEAFHNIGEYFDVSLEIAASVPRTEGVVFDPGEGATLESAMEILRITNPVFEYTIHDNEVRVK